MKPPASDDDAVQEFYDMLNAREREAKAGYSWWVRDAAVYVLVAVTLLLGTALGVIAALLVFR